MPLEQKRLYGSFRPSLRACLCHPLRQIQDFDEAQATHAFIPFKLWSRFSAIAAGGSLIYGASLGLLFRWWRPERSALWLALSAGGGWCVFGPVLILVSRRRMRTCAQACLTTMAYGEAVLVSGAGVNLWLRLRGGCKERFLARWNSAVVGFSNLVMLLALTRQLHALNVPVWKTVLSWMVALNGSGAALFALFRRLLQGGH